MGEKLSFREKFCYGCGEISCNFVFTIVTALLVTFYTDVVGISPAIIGTIIAISQVFNGASDVCAGFIVDRTRSKYGRARVWELRMSIPYAVASSSHPQAIQKFLSHAGFVLSPNVIVSSKEGYKSKPAPDVFLAAAERLDVKPENCLVLEDSKHGIMAAANAKMHSIFIQDQIAPDDEMKEYIQESCKDLNEVIDYLKRCK